jgi:hypothetical protein
LAGGTSFMRVLPMNKSPPLISSRPQMLRSRWIAATRRTHEDHEFAIGDLQVDAVQGLHVAIRLLQAC